MLSHFIYFYRAVTELLKIALQINFQLNPEVYNTSKRLDYRPSRDCGKNDTGVSIQFFRGRTNIFQSP